MQVCRLCPVGDSAPEGKNAGLHASKSRTLSASSLISVALRVWFSLTSDLCGSVVPSSLAPGSGDRSSGILFREFLCLRALCSEKGSPFG